MRLSYAVLQAPLRPKGQHRLAGLPIDTPATLRRTSRRYRRAGGFARCYIAAKLRSDPVHADLLSLSAAESFGDVVDIGCGRGQLALALLEAGGADSVFGLDWNPTHLHQAHQAAAGLAFTAAHRDLTRDQSLPHADTIMLIDVLYQLDTDTQAALLQAAAQAARRLVLIRTADPAQGLRSALTRTLERLGRRITPSSGAHVNARPIATLTDILHQAGFTTHQTPCHRGTPFANLLITARRCQDGVVG